MWKHGGLTIVKRLHEFICRIKEAVDVALQWKDGKLISIFKKKGERAVCGNSKGFALIFIAGKILANIMLIRPN